MPALLICLAGLTQPAPAQTGDVEAVLDQFGAGPVWRPGEFTAIRLKLTAPADSALDEVTTVWVQWEAPNADGDIAEYGRSLPLTKGRATRVWLYAPLRPDDGAQTVWPVRVFAQEDGRRGRVLGSLRISPSQAGRVPIRCAMIGVVGSSQMSLGQYPFTPISGSAHGSHEPTRLVFGMRPADLPDRWEGLKCFEAIAWSNALPQDLPAAQAEALREYVRRGGHLIISLPEDTNPWGLGEIARTDLQEMLPGLAPRKDEDVPISELLPVMSKAGGLGRSQPDFTLSIRVFKDLQGGFSAIDNHYEPLIALPDGRVVAVQRTFGHGRITIIGIDLANGRLDPMLLSNGTYCGLPQADVFWNRVLGRRCDTPLPSEVSLLEQEKRLAREPSEKDVGRGALFRQQITMTGAAGAGLAMALLLFLAYWAIAGPGGFALLKQRKQVQHAWLAFAAAAGAFTVLAWLGVMILRKNEVGILHVTFLDHVARSEGGWGDHDPQMQRAVSWFSAFLPGYIDATVGIESAPADGRVPAQRDLLTSWAPPGESVQKFPDIDRYTVNVSRNTDDFILPSRSTATHLYANWLGGLDPEWGGMLREDPSDPIRVEIGLDGRETIRGSIINDLPGDLTGVTLIWVQSQRNARRRYASEADKELSWIRYTQSGQLLNLGRMTRVNQWDEGTSYQPAFGTTADFRMEFNIYQRYVRPLEGGTLSGTAVQMRATDLPGFMETLCIYNQLKPPAYLKRPNDPNPNTVAVMRMLGRELDLSPWFSRPCLIVIGFLNDSSCPIPLRVRSERVKSTGVTVVRWIRPLPLNESIAFRIQEEKDMPNLSGEAATP